MLLSLIAKLKSVSKLEKKTPASKPLYFLELLLCLGYSACHAVICVKTILSAQSSSIIISAAFSTLSGLTAFSTLHFQHLYFPGIPSLSTQIYMVLSILLSGNRIRSYMYYGLNISIPINFQMLISSISISAIILFLQHLPSRGYKMKKDETPENSAGLFSILTFFWYNQILYKGFRKGIDSESIWDLPKNLEVTNSYEAFKNKLAKNKSLIRIMFETVRFDYIMLGFCRVAMICFAYLQPLLVKGILSVLDNSPESIEDPQSRSSKALVYGFSLFSATIIFTILSNIYNFGVAKLHVKLHGDLGLMLYDKALLLSAAGKAPDSKILNVMSVDVENCVDCVKIIHDVWSAIAEGIVAIVLLYGELGNSTFSILSMIVLFGLVVLVAAPGIQRSQERYLKFMDKRVSSVSNLLTSILSTKLYSYEDLYLKEINKYRNEELNAHLSFVKYISVMIAFMKSLPELLSLICFLTYAALNPQGLSVSKIFTSMVILGLFKATIAALAGSLSEIISSKVSYERITAYLKVSEVDTSANSVERLPSNEDDDGANVIEFKNCTIKWPKKDNLLLEKEEEEKKKVEKENSKKSKKKIKNEEKIKKEDTTKEKKLEEEVVNFAPVLKNISFQVKKGEILVVLGKVGSGKSALVNAILGEMIMEAKEVAKVRGTTALSSQTPWLLNATIKENIVFGKKFDKNWYEKVISACSLTHDIEILNDGDETLVGDKGLLLSGGQKQRIGLARAVYSNSDIVVFDDPLSAVDVHVGQHIFDNIISNKPESLLKDKTRVFITNAVYHLPDLPSTTKIILLKDEKIYEQGTFADLMNLKGEVYSMYNAVGTGKKKDSDTELKKPEEKREKLTSQVTKLEKSESLLQEILEKKNFNEDSKSGSVSMHVYKFYFKPWKLDGAALSFFIFVLIIAADIASSFWITHYSIQHQKGEETPFGYYFGIYSLLTLLKPIVQYFYVMAIVGYLSRRSSKAILDKSLMGVVGSPMSFFDTTPTGQILNRFSSDAKSLDAQFPMSIINFVVLIGVFITQMSLSSLSNPLLLLGIPVLFTLYAMIQTYYLATSRELTRLESVSKSPIYQSFGETIDGLITIRAFQAESRFREINLSHVIKSQSTTYLTMVGSMWLGVWISFVASLPLLAVILLTVSVSNNTNSSTASFTGLALSVLLPLSSIMVNMVQMYCMLENVAVSVERLKQYTKLKPEGQEEDDKLIESSWPKSGEIVFDDYSVKYRDDSELVLQNLSFRISPGEKIGIIGRTGAGKSSITNALFRIIESASGKILVDNIDISKIPLKELRSRMTIIPQDPYIFPGTLRLNIDPETKYEDFEVWSVLEKIGLKDFVSNSKNKGGLEMELGEDVSLSLGQKQLICLARALLKKSKILILDEATASIDVETDELIQKSLRTELKDCTVLTIAHRLNTIANSDKILVLDKGRVVNFAPPNILKKDELLN
ncbi:hypothetical protein HK099_008008 [Clydaea vesicula]|uniref:Uncharacterized protein n=1 Tax=Clydaea vesicula TaxID=447962 RepID=A0AAD5U0M1_9FUNG|nr:hypothetical protein HK099_008008 [Clydaea vesicula]